MLDQMQIKTLSLLMKGSLQAGYTKKMQEFAEWRRQQAEELAKLQQQNLELQQKARVVDDPEPPRGSTDDTPETWQAKESKHAEWTARKEYRRMIDSGEIPDPNRQQQQIAQYEQQRKYNEVAALIQAQPGYSQEIWDKMAEKASADPFWNAQPFEEAPALALFELVKKESETAELSKKAAAAETKKVQRKAKVARSTVPRTTGSKSKMAAETYKNKGFNDLKKLVLAADDEAG